MRLPSLQGVKSTPQKQLEGILREEQVPMTHTLLKKLLPYTATMKCIKSASPRIKKALFSKRVSGTKGLISSIARKISFPRRKMMRNVTPAVNRKRKSQKTSQKVVEFMRRVDNSYCLPGKRDVQKYAFTDTLNNLHMKYEIENVDSKISLSKFTKCKPKNIRSILWARKRECLCLQHANMVLLLLAVKNLTNSTTALLAMTTEEVIEKLDTIKEDRVHYRRWKREDVKGKDMKLTTKKEYNSSREDFKEMFKEDLTLLRVHAKRVENQFKHVRLVHTLLPPMTACTLQLDYAENYTTSYQDAVAVAYFQGKQITVHPMVIHYRNEENELCHFSIVGVSDVSSHMASTTMAFLRAAQPIIKVTLPELKTVHYVSDSPPSQYRNKTMVSFIAQHKALHNTMATWQYLESGHGKGPCDGVGGAVKKQADTEVKKGALITDAATFVKAIEKITKVKFIVVSNKEVAVEQKRVNGWKQGQVKGISRMHAVVPMDGKIWMRELSCLDVCCNKGDRFVPSCRGWIQTEVQVQEATSKKNRKIPPSAAYTNTDLSHDLSEETEEHETSRPPTKAAVVIASKGSCKTLSPPFLKIDEKEHSPLYKCLQQFPTIDLDDKSIYHKGSPFIHYHPGIQNKVRAQAETIQHFCEICDRGYCCSWKLHIKTDQHMERSAVAFKGTKLTMPLQLSVYKVSDSWPSTKVCHAKKHA